MSLSRAVAIPGRRPEARATIFALLCVIANFGARAAEPPAEAKEGEFDSNGVKIHYYEEGQGEPVLLIHGYTASARTNWGVTGVIRDLARDYRVIALDNRGHGKSDKPTSVDDYGDIMVEDAVRLLDHLKIEKARVVGYSMGGMITLKLLTKYPERVESAVIGGMGWFQTRFGGEILDRIEEPGDLTPQRACLRAFPKLSVSEEELKAIKVPMAVIIGENDGIRERYVEPMIRVRPDVPVTVISGANHTTAVFNAGFKPAIQKYVEELGKPPGKAPAE